jgi:hypothetical protein
MAGAADRAIAAGPVLLEAIDKGIDRSYDHMVYYPKRRSLPSPTEKAKRVLDTLSGRGDRAIRRRRG